jgi:hypothetical protein
VLVDDSEDDRLSDAAEGFQRLGAHYWPSADHFLLLELDGDGSCTGDARIVCRACVRQAVAFVLDRPADGSRRRFDLIGDRDPQDGPCCICGERPGC